MQIPVGADMFLDYAPEQRALRQEFRMYFAELLTPEIREQLGAPGEVSPLFRPLVGRLGEDGWLEEREWPPTQNC